MPDLRPGGQRRLSLSGGRLCGAGALSPARPEVGGPAYHGVVVDGDRYLLDNRQVGAGERLGALSDVFDPVTFRHLDALGIHRGWRCWEVGAGSPAVPSWMAGRVGPDGSVLSTDIDLSVLEGGTSRAFSVQQHDVGRQPPPPGPFDLVHARLVLVHVRERRAAMTAMVEVLRPGGWLVVEDADPALQPLTCIDEYGPAQALANKVRRGFRVLLEERGAELGFGRTLPRLFRENGLEEVGADAFFPVTGPACTVLELATVEQVGASLVDHGLISKEELAHHRSAVAAGDLDLATSPMITAWGRKPDR